MLPDLLRYHIGARFPNIYHGNRLGLCDIDGPTNHWSTFEHGLLGFRSFELKYINPKP